MTDKELDLNKKALYEQMRNERGSVDHNDIRYKELSCIDMINSILAYGFNKSATYVLAREYANYHNYLEDYVKALGEKKVLELIQNQIDDIDHIEKNVYTDCEGLSYNSIVWVR